MSPLGTEDPVVFPFSSLAFFRNYYQKPAKISKASQEWRLSKESFMQEAEAGPKQRSEGSGEWQGNIDMTDLATDSGSITLCMQLKAKDRLL